MIFRLLFSLVLFGCAIFAVREAWNDYQSAHSKWRYFTERRDENPRWFIYILAGKIVCGLMFLGFGLVILLKPELLDELDWLPRTRGG